MKTIRIRIEKPVIDRLDRLAREHGIDRVRLIRVAIAEKLEELEDFFAVKSRLEKPFLPVANEEVWRRLGLED